MLEKEVEKLLLEIESLKPTFGDKMEKLSTIAANISGIVGSFMGFIRWVEPINKLVDLGFRWVRVVWYVSALAETRLIAPRYVYFLMRDIVVLGILYIPPFNLDNFNNVFHSCIFRQRYAFSQYLRINNWFLMIYYKKSTVKYGNKGYWISLFRWFSPCFSAAKVVQSGCFCPIIRPNSALTQSI